MWHLLLQRLAWACVCTICLWFQCLTLCILSSANVCKLYLFIYNYYYLLQLSFNSVEVVLILVTNKNKYTQTKQYKNTVQTVQNTVNSSTHIYKTPTHTHTHKNMLRFCFYNVWVQLSVFIWYNSTSARLMKLQFIPQTFDSTAGPTQDAKKLTQKLHTFLLKKSVENVIERTSWDVRFSRHT